MTRKQLVEGLRALHENDVIVEIKYRKTKRKNHVEIQYINDQSEPLYRTLIIAYATK